MVILNILNLSLNLDNRVSTILVEVKWMMWCLRSKALFDHYISILGIFVSALHNYDAPMFWHDLADDVCSATSLSSFRKKLKLISYHKLTHSRFFACPGVLPMTLTLMSLVS